MFTQVRNECHIWEKIEKKTKKLKLKAWNFWYSLDDGSERKNAARIPTVKDTYRKFLTNSGFSSQFSEIDNEITEISRAGMFRFANMSHQDYII